MGEWSSFCGAVISGPFSTGRTSGPYSIIKLTSVTDCLHYDIFASVGSAAKLAWKGWCCSGDTGEDQLIHSKRGIHAIYPYAVRLKKNCDNFTPKWQEKNESNAAPLMCTTCRVEAFLAVLQWGIFTRVSRKVLCDSWHHICQVEPDTGR